MSRRRFLSLWLPRLAAERVLRQAPGLTAPLAIVAEAANSRHLASVSAAASAAGLAAGQRLADALALCPALVTRPADPATEQAFLAALRRWAGIFSPWVAETPPDGLMLDLTGCAHLFGGEAALLERIEAGCARHGLSLCAGLADTQGAAWALARFADQPAAPARSGDAIDQEARATRSRAARRHHRTGIGAPPAPAAGTGRIAAPRQTRSALAPLPVAALRLDPDTVAGLNRMGLRHVGDLAGAPRAPLARRFGPALTRRLDQALGLLDEPLSPAPAPPRFATRLTLPEPIGLTDDILAAIDQLLPPLCARLERAGRGARALRLQIERCDRTTQSVTLGLARPMRQAAQIRPLLAMKANALEAGFGIDRLRLEAYVTEPVAPRQDAAHTPRAAAPAEADLIARIGARIGLDAITRAHPAESHIPEKTAHDMAAAWSDPAGDWPAPPAPRPLLLWRPEPVTVETDGRPPAAFRWRRRRFRTAQAAGPERIAPEWWLDDPDWRSGPRDYWRVETEDGARLWLFHARGRLTSGGWFCQGDFG
ncbi:DNA methylase [Maritimibacter sp. 55A14]|uniref:Y-family DNA polymerase n=1 Tax=Maritimibacter sp. 55A14 TaxID=2174844 RepID=UPI000D62104E|nr:DNA polymerase Y family protein [Maritimibacter sp. 55A14]PWE33475.1 DNA methylase [Maritimibacter sp. 55A14]